MKRTISITLMVCSIVMFLAACSKDKGGDDNNQAQLSGTVQVEGGSNQQ